jgi:hypothetical protein
MDRVAPILVAALVGLALGVSPTPARAQSNFTFVSGAGLDTNPCSLGAPCRSFAAAVLVTNAGGQVTMLDPAGYGRVTITKAISIVNDGGGEAGINAPGSSQDAITINAGPGDVVNLRGLTLNGVGTGRHGITFNTGGTLNVQHCVVRGFADTGVVFAPSASAAITLSDMIVSNNAAGVVIIPTNGQTRAYLERVTAIGNGAGGVSLNPGGTATIQGAIIDSAAIANISNGSGTGFALNSGAAGATIALINSKAIGNAEGVNAGTGTIVMSQVTIAGNSVRGFFSASFESFGDNYVIDNTNSGALSPISLQ